MVPASRKFEVRGSFQSRGSEPSGVTEQDPVSF
jgi:hypothetical protein